MCLVHDNSQINDLLFSSRPSSKPNQHISNFTFSVASRSNSVILPARDTNAVVLYCSFTLLLVTLFWQRNIGEQNYFRIQMDVDEG